MGNQEVIKHPGSFARRLQGDPLSLAICRIRNDFRPIDQIASSLMKAADHNSLRRYLLVSIASLCHYSGVRFSLILRDYPTREVQQQTQDNVPLPLSIRNVGGMSYVSPANLLFSERVLHRARLDFPKELEEQLFMLGELLAPFVSRSTIIQGTPEARASRRLFDYDEIVHVFAPQSGEAFYEAMEASWGWNSRYWEQRALLRLSAHNKTGRKSLFTDHLRDAVAHARHARSIEHHPFPVTTLDNVLMAVLDVSGEDRSRTYKEAFDAFSDAINMESARSRVSIQPLLGLMKGACKFMEMGERPSSQQASKLRQYIEVAPIVRTKFPLG